ncbi:rhomboid family intramembrane serine protease [Myxococcota bacterium]|nr:rhomboid family intramembrane serine protease [Myxococcota bacterium]
MADVKTCPSCGAMITPQLARCRHCKAYLHGTKLEGLLLEHLLPEKLQTSPATATIVFAIFLYYALMIVVTVEHDPNAMLGFSSFSLQQLGATHGPSILRGQWWRFVTSIFVHHDVLHLGLNLWSLLSVGVLVEKIFDRKKMLLIYLVSGITSMIISHFWYVDVRGDLTVVSGGASGAVCGMIGAAWFGARKLGPQGREVVDAMKRWTLLMVVWGLVLAGINNAAHLGGFVVGALLAAATPAGLTQTVAVQRVLSVLSLAGLAGVGVATALMIQNVLGFPTALVKDYQPRGILGFRYAQGYTPEHSDQQLIHQRCIEVAAKPSTSDDAIARCELAVRANDATPVGYEILAGLEDQRGRTHAADVLRRLARRLDRGGR